jgi:hypothetical protein
VNHFIFAEQTARFIPLAADTMRHAVLIRFCGSQHPVFVPGSTKAVATAFLQGHLLAELSIAMKFFLDARVHAACRYRHRSTSTPAIQHPETWKRNPELFIKGAINRGANSTHPHERQCEAPIRETRQAAPDGRVLRRLSRPVKARGFLVGLGRCDAKLLIRHYVIHCCNAIAEDTSRKFHSRLQPSRAGRQTSRHPATIPCDENLEANSPAAAESSRQERKPRPVASLNFPPPPYPTGGFHRADTTNLAGWLEQNSVGPSGILPKSNPIEP